MQRAKKLRTKTRPLCMRPAARLKQPQYWFATGRFPAHISTCVSPASRSKQLAARGKSASSEVAWSFWWGRCRLKQNSSLRKRRHVSSGRDVTVGVTKRARFHLDCPFFERDLAATLPTAVVRSKGRGKKFPFYRICLSSRWSPGAVLSLVTGALVMAH